MPGKVHIKGAPAKVNELYERIKEKSPGKSKEYWARVAWQVYCQNVNPDSPSCGPAGKTAQLSGPISSSKMTATARMEVARALRSAAKLLASR